MIDSFYYCPHRPDENCNCRKLKILFFKIAAKEHNIDLNSSWMLGDKDSDIEAGKNAGCNTIKIEENLSLLQAVQKIICSNMNQNH